MKTKYYKFCGFLFLILTFECSVLYCPANAIPIEEILKKVDKFRAPDRSFGFNLKVTVKKEEADLVGTFSVRIKDFKKSLVLFKSPASNRGRVLLMVEDNIWIYIPGTKNPIRISPQQQMMGNVSNADVARVVFNIDYKIESMEEDTLEGQRVLNLTLSATTKGAAYQSITLWVEKESFKPIKGEFFALTGKLLKTAIYKGYERILGQERLTLLEIRDAVKHNETSIMEYSNFKIQDTPEIYFQKTSMERAGSGFDER